MARLPTGTVTFLFTDIEGSTRLVHELGERYADVLAEHRRLLREAFARRGGVEVDTQGDAFFYAFSTAQDALAAAQEGQQALEGGPVSVRMGLHTGEPVVTDEGYVGVDVHRAARIAAVAHGRQTLLSQSTRDLVGGDHLRDLGEHRLKDLTAPERIYQLGHGEFPPLKSLNATNLPTAASPIVGRQRELEELQALLSGSSRLVTLTGTGGSGKTRLALQVGAELLDDFPGGVFFVPLAGVREPELVASTIASSVGMREAGELRDRKALLVVDNFEHVLDAAPAVGDLLAKGSQVRILATSRAPLRIAGELEYPIDPLPEVDALELLSLRARAVRPSFEPDAAAAEICRRVDGLPLALELAASRLRSLGSAALLERLDRRLPVLTGGRRDAPERQRTLRATVEWSYDLLDAQLQRVFGRLAVFAGTFSLEAAEAVVAGVLDDLDALVEASLLKPIGNDRFLMLETIRELAAERLDASGEADELRDRHAEFFAELARRANLNVEADGPMRHELVISEHDNVRAALQWTIAAHRGELGLRLAAGLENFWVTTDVEEGKRWLDALLPLSPAAPSHLHALATRCLANCTALSGEPEAGERLYRESLAEFEALGDELRAAVTRHRLAVWTARRGDEERGRQLLDESLEAFRRGGFGKGEAMCLTLLGDLERRKGAFEAALELYDRSLAMVRETGFTWWEQSVLVLRAETLFRLGRPAEAGRSAAEAVEVARRISHRGSALWALGLVARAAVEQGDAELGGRLWGAIETEAARAPVAGWEYDREELVGPLLEHAGPSFDAGALAGRDLSLEQAAEEALAYV